MRVEEFRLLNDTEAGAQVLTLRLLLDMGGGHVQVRHHLNGGGGRTFFSF
jgi:hypothetical protein